MAGRIAEICANLPPCHVFADIGCDHGYMTRYMLKNGLCERAYISDISPKCLKKAEILLREEISAGRCFPVAADGFTGLPEPCDLVLIAGMGGEEIVRILSRDGLPPRFLLQPMKNAEKVRRFIVGRGARIWRDYTFSEEGSPAKYYDLILGAAEGGDGYTEREYRFGRDNLNGVHPEPFLSFAREELGKTVRRLAGAREEESVRCLTARKQELEKIIYEAEGNL